VSERQEPQAFSFGEMLNEIDSANDVPMFRRTVFQKPKSVSNYSMFRAKSRKRVANLERVAVDSNVRPNSYISIIGKEIAMATTYVERSGMGRNLQATSQDGRIVSDIGI
jgi:hypothetical protein